MEPRLKKTVVMVGMMGAGKSAVGKELAQMLGVPFVDSDAEIERAANASIAEIFARDGEPFFRDKEAQVISRLLDGTPSVLSVGGGAFLRAETRRRISQAGISVWLKADLDTLWQRVKRKDTRPLLRTANPYQTLAALMADREPAYAEADLVVPTEAGFAIETTAEKVIEALTRRPDVLRTDPHDDTLSPDQ
ncbi:shikimate kinase [Pararhodobacter marinus]|uniref:Shikimate kinase n=1 Tax=Pararhodobacter marinus TaxID=2184063 RepID=A0A2U2C4M8_9RHOB|nr:shikimate kinase [Pararhodobacter marinus]PWE26823.1 shikimate kinase [Pararhodobacter marinus]